MDAELGAVEAFRRSTCTALHILRGSKGAHGPEPAATATSLSSVAWGGGLSLHWQCVAAALARSKATPAAPRRPIGHVAAGVNAPCGCVRPSGQAEPFGFNNPLQSEASVSDPRSLLQAAVVLF